MERSAIISPCDQYRYELRREWDTLFPARYVLFILLNPSTADGTEDDPTVRRCLGYARDWGYGSLVIANLFAVRATEPRDMMAAEDPVGPDNNHHLQRLAEGANAIICGWGTAGGFRGRDVEVFRLLRPHQLFSLRLTSQGYPSHPLYLPKHLCPTPWAGPEKRD